VSIRISSAWPTSRHYTAAIVGGRRSTSCKYPPRRWRSRFSATNTLDTYQNFNLALKYMFYTTNMCPSHQVNFDMTTFCRVSDYTAPSNLQKIFSRCSENAYESMKNLEDFLVLWWLVSLPESCLRARQ
jgi:hypothetical protein